MVKGQKFNKTHVKFHHLFTKNTNKPFQYSIFTRARTVQPDCYKGWVVNRTVHGDMLFKDLLGSIARVGYCIPVPDFYLVLHGLKCRKSTIMDKSIHNINSLTVSLIFLDKTNTKKKRSFLSTSS